MKPIILASGSPRRRELLLQAGLKFEVEPSSYKEEMGLDMEPEDLAKYLSQKKAIEVAKKHKDSIIIGADTFIVFEGELIGKPKTKEEAKEMLKKLSGKAHSVITGFTIIDTGLNKTVSDFAETKLFFRDISDEEINSYVETGEPLDKAGAYAIQGLGGIFVQRIEGDYYNIVGLPLSKVVERLKDFGISVF